MNMLEKAVSVGRVTESDVVNALIYELDNLKGQMKANVNASKEVKDKINLQYNALYSVYERALAKRF